MPPLKFTIKCCNLAGDQWICRALIFKKYALLTSAILPLLSVSIQSRNFNVTCVRLRRAPQHQPIWSRWISAPCCVAKKNEIPQKVQNFQVFSHPAHQIQPKKVKLFRKNQFHSVSMKKKGKRTISAYTFFPSCSFRLSVQAGVSFCVPRTNDRPLWLVWLVQI